MAYMCRFNLVILLVLFVANVVCYRQKRATGAVPQMDDHFIVNQRAQNLDTEAIANASLSSSNGLSRVVSLLESLVSNSQNLIVHQHAQNLDTDVIANASVSSSNDLSRVVNLLLLQNQQFTNLSDRVEDVVFSMSVLKKGMRLAAGDCSDIAKQGPYSSGVYKITPWDDLGYEGTFKVYCDLTSDDEGWTVIQRRLNGSVDFYRGWEEYKTGFGDLEGEFWLGLDKLYRLTDNTRVRWQLKVELEDFEGNTAYADYDSFSVGDESTNFQLALGAYSGTATTDSMTHQNNQAFSTKDRDNDGSSTSNVASTCNGGWWYKTGCYNSHLNGRYFESATTSETAITWWFWKRGYIALKKTQMKIKPSI